MINVPAQRTMLMILATTPVTWASGTAAIERSADVSFMQASYTVAEWMTLQCASIAPLGRPVVPDVSRSWRCLLRRRLRADARPRYRSGPKIATRSRCHRRKPGISDREYLLHRAAGPPA